MTAAPYKELDHDLFAPHVPVCRLSDTIFDSAWSFPTTDSKNGGEQIQASDAQVESDVADEAHTP